MKLLKQQAPLAFAFMATALVLVGVFQSWSLSLTILNYCLIASIMSLGLNIQWGYAGLFNVGLMGFAALGGMSAVLVTMKPVPEAWAVGGAGIGMGIVTTVATYFAGYCGLPPLAQGLRARVGHGDSYRARLFCSAVLF